MGATVIEREKVAAPVACASLAVVRGGEGWTGVSGGGDYRVTGHFRFGILLL